jgi:predicted O-methyltransferase YrrM
MKPHIYIDQWSMQPFNGQIQRANQIRLIAKTLKPSICIETGTYFGTSTPHLASMVTRETYTIEIDPQNFKKAKERLTKNFTMYDVRCIFGNSVREMKRILSDLNPNSETILAYLDAHWLKEIPTKQELELLCEWGGKWVAVIDDFEVPHDSGYFYDSYQDKVVNISQIPEGYNLKVYVPESPAQEESGARRGTGYIFPNSVFETIDQEILIGLKPYGA